MKKTTQRKLRSLIERIIREESIRENIELLGDFITSITSDSRIKAIHDKTGKSIVLSGSGLSYDYIGKMLKKFNLQAKIQKSGKDFVVKYGRTYNESKLMEQQTSGLTFEEAKALAKKISKENGGAVQHVDEHGAGSRKTYSVSDWRSDDTVWSWESGREL